MTEKQAENKPRAKGSEDVLREADKRWMEHYSGPCLEMKVSLGSAPMARIFKRDFNMTSRNIYFISVLGRALLGDEESRKAEEYVANNLKNSIREIDDMIKQAEVTILNNSVSMATFQNPEASTAKITTPFAKQFIDLLLLADKHLLLLNSLWLNGAITNDQRSQHELTTKVKVKSVSNSARNMFKAMLEEMNARKNGAGSKTVLNFGKKKGTDKKPKATEAKPATDESGAAADPAPDAAPASKAATA